MALFDGDSYGKDLSNASLWVEAAESGDDYGGGGYSGGGGCTDSGCFIMFLLFALFCGLPAVLITCVAYTFYG